MSSINNTVQPEYYRCELVWNRKSISLQNLSKPCYHSSYLVSTLSVNPLIDKLHDLILADCLPLPLNCQDQLILVVHSLLGQFDSGCLRPDILIWVQIW